MEEDPFSLEVLRGDSPAKDGAEDAVWNTTGLRLLYKELYLEVNSWTRPSSALYGLGERISSSGAQPPGPLS